MRMADLRPGRRTIRIVQLLVSLALLAVLWQAVGGADALSSLARADPRWLALAWIALTLQTLLSALRWKVTARRLGQRFTVRKAIGEYYLSQFVNQSLPGGMVGDVGRAVRARHQAGLLRATQGVVFERLSGQVVIFVVMAVAFFVTYLAPGGLYWPLWVRSIIVPLILIGLGAPVVFWLGGLLPGPQRRALDSLWSALHQSLLARDVSRLAGRARDRDRRLHPVGICLLRARDGHRTVAGRSSGDRAADPVHHADPDLRLGLGPARRGRGGAFPAGGRQCRGRTCRQHRLWLDLRLGAAARNPSSAAQPPETRVKTLMS